VSCLASPGQGGASREPDVSGTLRSSRHDSLETGPLRFRGHRCTLAARPRLMARGRNSASNQGVAKKRDQHYDCGLCGNAVQRRVALGMLFNN